MKTEAIREDLCQRLERAEQALRQCRDENEAAFELAGVGRADVELETGRIVRANRAFREIVGYTTGELREMTLRDISHPEDSETLATALPKILNGERSTFATEKRYIHKDGRIAWVSIHAALLPGKPGCPLTMTGVVQDITAQKNAEAAANESATKFRAIFENSIDAIAAYRGELHAMVNPAYLRLFGYSSPEELIGKPGPDLIAPSARGLIRERIEQRMRGENVPSAYISRGLRKDGSEFDLEIHASHFDLEGERFRLVILRDVTEQLRSAEELESRVVERTADLQRANRYLLAMKRCTEELAKATDETALLNSVCEIIAKTGENRFAWAGYPRHDAAKSVEIMAAQGLDLGYLRDVRITWADIPTGHGPGGRAIRSGTIQVSQNTQTDPSFAPWKEAALQRGYLSTICVPLMWERECLGIVSIYAGVPNAFSPEELALLEQFAGDLAFGIVALRTRGDRERLQKELLESSEQERSRIGKDLHDGVCQQLCAIHLFADLIAGSLPSQDAAALKQLRDLKELVKSTMVETRMLSRGLSPVAVESQGLVAGLLDLAMNTERLCQIACEFHCPEPALVFDKTVSIHLYRIAQEAIYNAVKHSQAGSIRMRLTRAGAAAALEVLDDGIGVEPGVERGGGMGLRSMRYRANVLGGELEIGPAGDKGTRVACTFKYEDVP